MPLPFEMESLTTPASSRKKNDERIPRPSSSSGGGASQFSQQFDAFIVMTRMYMQHYPKITLAVGCVLGFFLFKFLFLRHSGDLLFVAPQVSQHYGDLQSNYELKAAKIDHWCLHGGNNDCSCDDPTDAMSREDADGWLEAHKFNKQIAKQAAAASAAAGYNRQESFLDVVFYGDGTTQAWTGQLLPGEPIIEGAQQVAKVFNSTFHKDEGGTVDGIALGIGGDSVCCDIDFGICNLFAHLRSTSSCPESYS